MRLSAQAVLSVLCFVLGLENVNAQTPVSVLNAIPSDAIGFAVIHNMTETSRSIAELAKLVHAPAPDLLGLAKQMTGFQKGVEEQGDLAIVLTALDPAPKHVILMPVVNFADFFASLNVEAPASGIVEAQMFGGPVLVGRKGNYAVLARSADRDALDQFLTSTTNLASDAALGTSLAANNISGVVTSGGLKQVIPKLSNAIRAIQAQLRQAGGEQGPLAADGLNVYIDALTAAEPEVEQFGIGLHVDSAKNIDLVKHVRFTPNGHWAQWAAKSTLASEDLLSGLPAGPFVAAFGGVIPQGAMDQLMALSAQMMQKQPQFQLTPEQSQQYIELSKGMMSSAHSMRMLIGVADSDEGIYGNASILMTVDDSHHFLEQYEKSLAAMRSFVQEIKNSAIPVATTQRIHIGDIEALEVSMDLSGMNKITPAGGPDPQKIMQLMTGSSDTLKMYIAPADEHTVVLVYTSQQRLKSALEFYKSKKPGLSGDTGVAKVAGALPPGSQVVGFAALSGIAKVVRQFAAIVPGGRAAVIPDFPDSPPLGISLKFVPTGAEAHLVVAAETLQAIGDTVVKFHGVVPGPDQHNGDDAK